MLSANFSVCVFCGSRKGIEPSYMAAARAVGRMIGGQNWRLVYGAGDVGMMGEVAQNVTQAGGDTFGVIPEHLLQAERASGALNRIVITQDMHERKKVMFMNCDAIVVLPGGIGTLDEFFEVVTWHQLGLHKKPIILLNTNGYWDRLLVLLDHIAAQGFADDAMARRFAVVPDVAALTTSLLTAQRHAT